MLKRWIDDSTNDCSINSLYTEWDNKEFFKQIPLELFFVEPKKFSFNLTILIKE